jgi:hypothetical protein
MSAHSARFHLVYLSSLIPQVCSWHILYLQMSYMHCFFVCNLQQCLLETKRKPVGRLHKYQGLLCITASLNFNCLFIIQPLGPNFHCATVVYHHNHHHYYNYYYYFLFLLLLFLAFLKCGMTSRSNQRRPRGGYWSLSAVPIWFTLLLESLIKPVGPGPHHVIPWTQIILDKILTNE